MSTKKPTMAHTMAQVGIASRVMVWFEIEIREPAAGICPWGPVIQSPATRIGPMSMGCCAAACPSSCMASSPVAMAAG